MVLFDPSCSIINYFCYMVLSSSRYFTISSYRTHCFSFSCYNFFFNNFPFAISILSYSSLCYIFCCVSDTGTRAPSVSLLVEGGPSSLSMVGWIITWKFIGTGVAPPALSLGLSLVTNVELLSASCFPSSICSFSY